MAIDYDRKIKEEIFLERIRKLYKDPIASTGADFRRYVKKYLVHVVKEDLYRKILDIIDR